MNSPTTLMTGAVVAAAANTRIGDIIAIGFLAMLCVWLAFWGFQIVLDMIHKDRER